MYRILPIFILPIFALLLLLGAPSAMAQETITVFAAASLKNALDDINTAFTKANGEKVIVSYGASSALAKQIEQGAPADIFISADLAWMNYVTERNLMNESTRLDLLGNRLVLIASKHATINHVTIDTNVDLAGIAGAGRIAIADTAVPAGRYAKAALESLGVWEAAKPKLAPAENVRAVLAYVARGEAPLGIVYETDAKAESRVKIIGLFPADSHPAIIYAIAAVAASKNASIVNYLNFMRTSEAKVIFERHGFIYWLRTGSCEPKNGRSACSN